MTEEERDWGRFFKQMFKEGEKFTEELLKENQWLKQRVGLLEHELAQATIGLQAEGFITVREYNAVVEERNRLKKELAELKRRIAMIESDSADIASQYAEIERQNSSFASLYVASYQLHSTLDFDRIVEIIKEVVINLIGAECFGIYLLEAAGRRFTLVGSEGLDDHQGRTVPLGENLLSRVARSGELYLDADVTEPGDIDRPIAVLPLLSSEELVGVLAIHKLLVQKDGFEPIDMELFDLLGAHAGTALMAAQMYSRTERKAMTLEGVIRALKGDDALPPTGGAE